MSGKNTFLKNFNFSISERKVFLVISDNVIAICGIYLYFLLLQRGIDFDFYVSAGVFVVINLTINGIFKTYTLRTAAAPKKLHLILFVYFLSFSIFFLTPKITPSIPGSRILVLYLIIVLPLFLTLWRYFYIMVIHQPNLHTNALLLGESTCMEFLNTNFNYGQNGYKLIKQGKLDPGDENGTWEEYQKLITEKNINVIILAFDEVDQISNSFNRFLNTASLQGVEVYSYLRFYEQHVYALPIKGLGKKLFMYFPFTRSNYNLIYKGLHRSLDLVTAGFGLLFLLVILPLIILLNLFFNRGPLFFNQYRVGKGGQEILITKLRSMKIDAESKGAQMAKKNDPRITAFGKILRKFRLDELPQFWAVLKGDMSLIGPRPEQKVFVEQLKEQIPFYDLRHMVKPGITGWAQVKYKYGENLEDSYKKLEYDLYYIKNRSIILDIRIIIDTINTVIFSKGQ